jgi:hypothetical protein
MDFCHPKDSIGQTHLCDSLELFPAAWTKLTAQPHDISHSAADGYRFNLHDFINDLEVHTLILRIIGEGINSVIEKAENVTRCCDVRSWMK